MGTAVPVAGGVLKKCAASPPASGVVEATSLAVVEAMACGTIPIASNIGGLAELIDDDRTGLLVPPGDGDALAEAMTRAADDPALRDRLIAAASEKARRDYDTAPWLARVVDVYDRARGA